MLKFHTLVIRNTPYHTAIIAREALTHTLSFNGPPFWGPVGPLGSNPKFNPTGDTAYMKPNACPNFDLLAFLVPEIMRLKGAVTS